MSATLSQREIARTLLRENGILRLAELRAARITAATICRMERSGEIIRLSKGIYQLHDAPLDLNHSLAEATKRLPKNVVCLVSALAFHGLTDQLPRKIWMAIGEKDWGPTAKGPPIHISRFTRALLSKGVDTHVIEGVPVKVFGVAKTVPTASDIETRLASRSPSNASGRPCDKARLPRPRSVGGQNQAECRLSFDPISRLSPHTPKGSAINALKGWLRSSA